MSLMEMLGLTVAVLLLGYLARNMLELSSGAKRLPPARPSEPRSPHDPLTMSWDEPERRERE
jgi:hypothetical protein